MMLEGTPEEIINFMCGNIYDYRIIDNKFIWFKKHDKKSN